MGDTICYSCLFILSFTGRPIVKLNIKMPKVPKMMAFYLVLIYKRKRRGAHATQAVALREHQHCVHDS
jgi:hypothetical protein